MSIKKTNARCTGCGGSLIFDSKSQNLICKNCNSQIEIDKVNKLIKKDYTCSSETSSIKGKSTNCSSCGALLEIKEREITKTCPYCNNNFVLELEEINGLKPDLIIPFQFDKKEAIEKFKQGVKKKHFLPNKFKKSPNFSKIDGTYISSFSFDSKTQSSYSGRLAKDESYTDSNGNRKTRTTYQNISGDKSLDFENVIVESSSQANQALFEEIKPFNINNQTVFEYNPDFIRGYLVESYDNSLSNAKVISEDLMKSRIKNAILANYRYDRVVSFNLSTNFFDNKYNYMLVPVYFINIDYKKKTYITYLNGQTGRLGENLPKSKLKIAMLFLIPILLITAFIVLINVLPNL